jgi:hypothetical protein
MICFRVLFALLGGLALTSSQALTPVPDSTAAFLVGDWIGMGAGDAFCFMRLRPDGSGTVFVSGASGDWLGATIRWRNQRQRIVLIGFGPLPAEPQRRMMPLAQLVLNSGINQTIQLKSSENTPTCELQLRADVMGRAAQAERLLDVPADARKANGGK